MASERKDMDDAQDGDALMPSTAAKEEAPSTLPWVEKYRPATLSDLISQQDIVNTITRLIDAGRLPHLLFYGPPGTGKTSTILALARKLYGNSFSSMVLQLNASDERGIDVVRDQIKTFASTRKLFSSGVKLVVLDEADAMTSDAQFALRRVIEKFTGNTRFCLICNYVSKIIPALQSRCTRFRFAPLDVEQIRGRLRHIVEAEKITERMQPDGEQAILRLAKGDMRRVLNILQATASGFETIDASSVYACTGNPAPADVKAAMGALMNSGVGDAYTFLAKLSSEQGLALADIVAELAAYVRGIKLPADARILILSKLADVEYRLAFGTADKVQLASLVAAFAQLRSVVQAPGSSGGASGGASSGGAGGSAAAAR